MKLATNKDGSPLVQNSLSWLRARAGVVTASEMGEILTPEFAARKSEGREKYLALKLAERWTGEPVNDFVGTFAMDQGHVLEDEAIPFFELRHNIDVQRVGLCLTDDGRVGCSPDGLIGEDEGLEVKCPNADTHVSYLMAGELPKKYATQVHGAMYVTGRPRWRFLSYRRGFPPLELTIERDEAIQSKIHEALTKFLADFDAAWEKLKSI